MKSDPFAVLFVCMGNICRSPTAEAVFRQQLASAGLADYVRVDSAGTHDYHVGRAPDGRAQAAARARGIDMSGLRARQVSDEDFEAFDWILVMDEDNLAGVNARCPEWLQGGVALLLAFAGVEHATAVPDPYYGESDGFEQVLDLLEAASERLIQRLPPSVLHSAGRSL